MKHLLPGAFRYLREALYVILAVALLISVTRLKAQAAEWVIPLEDTASPGNVAPEIIEGRVFVPLRLISESMGYEVNYNEASARVTVGGFFSHDIGTSMVERVDGSRSEIDVASYIKDGHAMVSLRLFGEAIGAKVSWDDNAREVHITMEPAMPGFFLGDDDFTVYGEYLESYVLDEGEVFNPEHILVQPIDLDGDGFLEVIYLHERNTVITLRIDSGGSVSEVGESLEVQRSPIQSARVVSMQNSEALYIQFILSDGPEQSWFILTKLIDNQLLHIDTSRAMADVMSDYLVDSDEDGKIDGYVSEHSGEDVLDLQTSFIFVWDAAAETFSLDRMSLQLRERPTQPEGVVREYLALQYLVQNFLDSVEKCPEIEERLTELLQGNDRKFDATVLNDMERALIDPEAPEIFIECTEIESERSELLLAKVTFLHGEETLIQNFALRLDGGHWVIDEVKP